MTIKITYMTNVNTVITMQNLAQSEDLLIEYSDNDIVIVDSIQKYVEVSSAQVSLNAIIMCTKGSIETLINGEKTVLEKNQMAIIPSNMIVTDIIFSEDFDFKGMFLTNRILQDFLRDNSAVWNELMFVQRKYVYPIEEEKMQLFKHFYQIMFFTVAKEFNNPYRVNVIQSILKSFILWICGILNQNINASISKNYTDTANSHFQHFLDLLNASHLKYRSVESIAADLCITPKHLSLVCKKCSGKSAKEWIREQTLTQIRFLLKETDLSIKQISDKMNFPNYSFFGKYVKKHYGVTPCKLRITLREKTQHIQ